MRRDQRIRRQRQAAADEVLLCSQRACQDEKVPAVNTIRLTDALTGKQVLSHRCAEHTHPMHTVVATVQS